MLMLVRFELLQCCIRNFAGGEKELQAARLPEDPCRFCAGMTTWAVIGGFGGRPPKLPYKPAPVGKGRASSL